MQAAAIGFVTVLVLALAGIPLGFALILVGIVGFAAMRAGMVGGALVQFGGAGLSIDWA